jgi:hypothetical protein
VRRGWRRIAIVVSAVWMVGGSLYISGLIADQAASIARIGMDRCEEAALAAHKPLGPCMDEFTARYLRDLKTAPTQTGIPILDGAVVALGILLAAWLAFAGVYAVVAWVRRGFAADTKRN